MAPPPPPPSSLTKKPADVSAASKEKNEYIPAFIAKKPFYVADDGDVSSSGADYLDHQRLQSISTTDQKWYDRGRKLGPAATKFRKGACENCGAMTHKTKECLSRPRKQGARWTGKDIQADEVVQDVKMGWDAKRDRWNGYDAREYDGVVEEFNALEEMKKKQAGRIEQKTGDEGEEEGDGHEGAKYEEETDMGRQQSTSTRNLRLREDTAKYLLNLDLESAKYDPKTRSMVDSGATADQAAALVAEEGFMRASGDAAEFENAQKYAWEASERGDTSRKVHLQANPTAGEFLRKKELEENDMKRAAHRKALLEKYGGQEHLANNPAKDAAVVESERYVEYDERGKIKGAPVTKAKSKYPEDILNNNHTSVWGSWWKDFKWGYACCHSTVKNSYCTGEEGKRALDAAQRQQTGIALQEGPKQIAWQDKEPTEEHESDRHNFDKHVQVEASKKRTLKDTRDGITDEDMEEYRRKRVAADDPMANLLGRDELVHCRAPTGFQRILSVQAGIVNRRDRSSHLTK